MPNQQPKPSEADGGTRGRDLFSRAQPMLSALTGLFRLMPSSLVAAMWSFFDGWRGRIGVGVRYAMARRLAAEIGDCVYFGEYVEVRSWRKLKIGSNVSIHRGCYVEALGGVRIGNDVSIAHGTSIISFEHTWEDDALPIRDNPLRLREVVIDDDVWVGCGVRILAGVHLQTRTVVAAGAVVAASHDGRQVLGGVPAKPIKRLA